MKVIVSHPTSNQVNRAMLRGLNDEEMLHSFYTSVAAFPNGLLHKMGCLRPFSEILRRSFDSSLSKKTHAYPYMEIMRMLLPKIGLSRLTQSETDPYSVWSSYKYFDKRVSRNLIKESKEEAAAIYAYEDGAYETFIMAKELGLKCFYDQPIGYWRAAKRMFQEEREKWPEWRRTMPSLDAPQEKLNMKDKELSLADCVFAASTFTATTLSEYPGIIKETRIIPFGFPQVKADKDFKRIKKGQKLRILFVGGLSQRKGIANMFSALKNFKNEVSLTVVGRKMNNDCAALNKELSKHNYIPSLPYNKVIELMGSHDLFLFPSLFEGFGLVITEAMSQGLPVITTPNTAGGDLIEHGKNGWIVAPGSTEAIIVLLEDLIRKPDQIVSISEEALKTAGQRPWSVYAHDVVKAIYELNS